VIDGRQINRPATWRNPGGGFELGCMNWTAEADCMDWLKGDHLFALKRKVK
jgi:hypothetical protein